MIIDLSPLHSHTVSSLAIDLYLTYDQSFLEHTDIQKLEDVHVVGQIKENSALEDEIKVHVEGEMLLLDAISLEEVSYPFSFEIERILEENDKKDENSLDIMDILWENIVLEIPLKFTKVEDLSKFHGDGWSLVSEDEVSSHNNPFSDLLKEFGEE